MKNKLIFQMATAYFITGLCVSPSGALAQSPTSPPPLKDISGSITETYGNAQINWGNDPKVPEANMLPPIPAVVPAPAPETSNDDEEVPAVAAAAAPMPLPAPKAHKLKDIEDTAGELVDHISNKVDPVMRIVDDTKAVVEAVGSIAGTLNKAASGSEELASDPLSVLPDGANSAMDLHGWERETRSKIYNVNYDLPGGQKITLYYRISAQIGGQLNGHGRYISHLRVQEYSISVPAMYEVTANVIPDGPYDIGQSGEPIAKLDLQLKISVKYSASVWNMLKGRPDVNIKSAFFTVTGDRDIELVDDAGNSGPK